MDREKLIDIKDEIFDKLTDLMITWNGYRYSSDKSNIIAYEKEKRAKRDAEKARRRAAVKEATEGKNE